MDASTTNLVARCLADSPCTKIPQALIDFDTNLLLAFADARPPQLLKLIQWLTNGAPGIALMILAVLLFWRASSGRAMHLRQLFKNMTAILYAIMCLGLSDLLATLLKKYVGRVKPSLDATAGLRLSFPSNHACNCATLAVLSYLLLRPTLKKPGRYLALALSFAALVAMSRVYLWEHYLTDVIAGLCLGAIFGLICGVAGRRFLGQQID